MKLPLFILALAMISYSSMALAKTVNVPSADVVAVIKMARQHLQAQHVDLSHRFLASVEYKNLHNEYEPVYWLLTWALLAGTGDGQIYVRVSNTGQVSISPSQR